MTTTATRISTSSSEAVASNEKGVTARVVALSLLLAVFFGYLIPIIDVKMSNTFLGATHLPPGAIAVLLFLLLVLNPLLRLLSNKLQFSRNEVLVVYISCLFSCLVPGHGSESSLVGSLVGPFYFSTRANGWLDFLGPNLQPWFTPAIADGGRTAVGGNAVVQAWYTGTSGDGVFVPWGAWLVPLVAWGSLILASYAMLACLSVMLRAQWAGREALAFPLLRLPLEMTEDVDSKTSKTFGRFFHNPMMWVGFGIAFFIQILRGLHVYFADVPNFPLELDLGPYFRDVPWNQIGWTPLSIYPMAIGITYLLTSEISFSLWAFYWLMKFQLIFAYTAGFQPSVMPSLVGNGGQKLFVGLQIVGAFMGYVGLVLWTGREHLGHVARRALGRAKASEEEKNEALSYPVAFWGFVVSLAICIGWSIAAGLSPFASLWLWGGYLIIALGLSRAICEGGILFVQQGWAPLGALAHLFGSGPGTLLPASSVVPGGFIQAAMITDMRSFLMPSFIQSFKLAHDRKIAARPLLGLISVIILIGLAMGLWMNVRLGHQHSGLSLEWWFSKGAPQDNANNISTLAKGLQGAAAPSLTNWFWLSFGAFATLGMMLMRARYMWFPLHPLGYLLSLSYPLNKLWFSIFLGWLFKVLVSRFGGSDTYRKTTPLFLGLALGDVAAMLFWLLIDGWQGRTGHQLMPG